MKQIINRAIIVLTFFFTLRDMLLKRFICKSNIPFLSLKKSRSLFEMDFDFIFKLSSLVSANNLLDVVSKL